MTNDSEMNDPDDDACNRSGDDLGSGRRRSAAVHPLYDNLAEFRFGDRQLLSESGEPANAVSILGRLVFPGLTPIVYFVQVPAEGYSAEREHEVARRTCYEEIPNRLQLDHLPSDPKAAVQALRNVRRRF